MSGLIKKGVDIPTVLALHLAWNVGRSWALPGLHNVIFGSGGAALAQIHLSHLLSAGTDEVLAGACHTPHMHEPRLYSTQDLFLSTFVPGDSNLWHKAKAG